MGQRRRCAVVLALIGVVVILSGCMEALRTDADATTPSSPFADRSNSYTIPITDTEVVTDEVIVAQPDLLLVEEPSAMPTEVLPWPPVPTEVPEHSPFAPPTMSIVEEPTIQAPVVIAPDFPVLSPEDRWRAEQRYREVFDPPRAYTTNGSELWWFDPVNHHHVVLGNFSGDFQAQARFILRGQAIAALEVPYQVNHSYGLTSISSELVARIHAAGYGDWIETYVFFTPDVQAR